MKIKGFENLISQLEFLDQSLTEKAFRRAGKLAMQNMLDEARRLVPFDNKSQNSIHLKNDLKLRSKNRGGDVIISLGTSRKTIGYAMAIEYGRKEFTQKRHSVFGQPLSRPSNVTIGATIPQPFMRSAYHNEKDNVIKLFNKYLEIEINKAVKRSARNVRG